MDDSEKGALPADNTPETESIRAAKEAKDSPEHDAAAAKLWAVYVSEAEKYDRGLVESWKSDMEGMLIFAGLFSASLTAFLIESYKTLNPDSGDTTALLLAQISQQLAASANGTSFQIPPTTPFKPAASSLICNILWFISLGLSLTCALIATLLEQWARDFLHRADMRSAPVVRARVFSFLYYGLKRFKMHTVVEIIPLLLHASLFLFFVGLVAFLLPVNVALTVVVGIILATVTVVYAFLTLIPLVHLDCPYRTPLSRGFWALNQSVQTMFSRWCSQMPKPVSQLEDETIVERVFRKAIESSPQRSRRDTQALVWTVKSLADDNELEPFLEAIPDALWLPDPNLAPPGNIRHELQDSRRYVYDDHMRSLMDDLNVQLLRRLGGFHNSCSSGLLSQEVRLRREICVYKAVWALGCLSVPGQPAFPALGSPWNIDLQVASEATQYARSAIAIQQWANMCAAQPLLEEALRHLTVHKFQMHTDNFKIPDLSLLEECMSKLTEYSIYLSSSPHFLNVSGRGAESLLPEIEYCIESIHTLPFTIFVSYLSSAANLGTTPYRFTTTEHLLRPTTKTPFSSLLRGQILGVLGEMMEQHVRLFQAEENYHWLDDVFATILWYWKPEESDILPWAVLDYLNCRKSDDPVHQLSFRLSEDAWKALPRSIGAELRRPPTFGDHTHKPMDYPTSSLTAVWRLCHAYPRGPPVVDPSVFEELIDSGLRANVPLFTPSVIAIAKYCFFGALASTAWRMHQQAIISSFSSHRFPAQTSIPTPTTEEVKDEELEQMRLSLSSRCTEAVLDTLSEFIASCISGDLPYKAVETVACINWYFPTSIHPVHQLRFSGAVQDLLNAAVDSSEREALSQQVLNLLLFSAYATDKRDFNDSPYPSSYAWLEDPEARNTLKGTLSAYVTRLASTGTEHRLCSRVQKIVANLDIMHPQQAIVDLASSDNIHIDPE
ncbi:hypothetical protein DFH06DRAFT_1473238 [Mycena polygramma]|nr:hypothetical protein DFH06DRAFT_1473238 [Mycena polygramma]